MYIILEHIQRDRYEKNVFVASELNNNISSWDVSSVLSMVGIFDSVSSFNNDISSLDVSSLTSMEYIFRFASKFNSNRSSSNISNATRRHGRKGGSALCESKVNTILYRFGCKFYTLYLYFLEARINEKKCFLVIIYLTLLFSISFISVYNLLLPHTS